MQWQQQQQLGNKGLPMTRTEAPTTNQTAGVAAVSLLDCVVLLLLLQTARQRERMSLLLAKAKQLQTPPAAAAAAAAEGGEGEAPAAKPAAAAAMQPAEKLQVREKSMLWLHLVGRIIARHPCVFLGPAASIPCPTHISWSPSPTSSLSATP